MPLIVRWPGKVKAGSTVDQPVISTDWTPTLLATAGVSTSEKFDGLNMLENITQNKDVPPRPLYWHQPHYMNQGSRPMGAIREGKWKLIEHYENGRCELYDLANDSGEAQDVSAQHPARVAELRGKLEKWRREVGAQENLPNPDFNASLWKKLYADVDVSRVGPAVKSSAASSRLTAWRSTMNEAVSSKKPASGSGAIILAARDARVHGEKLRHEPEPHKDTIGYWANMNDWVEWTFTVPHAGTFEVELLQAAGAKSGGATIEVEVAGQTLAATIEETGHFQRFIPRTIGTVKLDQGKATLTVRAKTKPGFGVMDLRRVVLRSVK